MLLKDTDGDQLPDCIEQYLGTDPNLVDTDGDMLDDDDEIYFETNPDTNGRGSNYFDGRHRESPKHY